MKILQESQHTKSCEGSQNTIESQIPNAMGQPTFSSRFQSHHNNSNPNFNDPKLEHQVASGNFSIHSQKSLHPIPTFAPIQETGKTDDFINSIEKFSDDITDFIKSRDEKLGFTNQSGMKPSNALVRELSKDNWQYFNIASRRGKTLSPDEKSNSKQVSALKSSQTK